MNGQDHDSESDIDARFAEIIAGWDDDVEGVPPEAASSRRDPDALKIHDLETDDLETDDLETDDLETDDGSPRDAHEAGPAPVSDQAAGPSFPFPVWRGPTTPMGDPDDAEAQGAAAPDDPDDHFTRPEIEPLPPGEDLHFWGIVIGLVAGPLLLLWLVLFRPNVSSWWTLLALALSLGGFVLLVLRQPRDRNGDDDNGARI